MFLLDLLDLCYSEEGGMGQLIDLAISNYIEVGVYWRTLTIIDCIDKSINKTSLPLACTFNFEHTFL